ncbi:2-oxo-hepta-3-ene-1,7-dioic acid hydratase [Polaromonas sp. CG9_12]|uniref:2-keto-4-pentenoate hydratase n=1 Tax=Polaromonas sp. CG_9.11 TaxID=2787730 RepID=UPI0004DDCF3A|nr:hydratase [Polaromonas sp. CG_9.11]MBG6075233.1 2-oxo-3-hexenedioate decarboxylase [Polaromonas sp. CG_9.11]CDS53927.1 2-oxo-hepta-3-ene-1,7-dioic acid hydratase [Polaromonas sp. CG9_12]
MTDSKSFSDLADRLEQARLKALPLDWPATMPVDLPQAYAAALAVRAARIRAGDVPAGYKVGFTNRNIWPHYQVDSPIWGTVWQGSVTQATSDAPDAAVLSLDGLCEPRIEPEIVFCLRDAPPPDCSADELVASLDWVAHGFEIVHTHFSHWKFTAAQAVADAGLHGLLLVGARIPVPAGTPTVDLVQALAGLTIRLYGDGALKDEGRGANVLDGPVQALLHFVRELRATPGAPALKAGDLVTTGTLTDAHPVAPGQTWQTQIESSGPVGGALAGLTVRFE